MTDILQINRSIRNILIVALGILLIALLRELAGLLIPLVFAGILALLCIPLVNILRKIGIPKALILIVVALVVSSILVMVINIFINTFSSILSDLDELSTMFNNKISLMTKWAVDTFNVKLDTSGGNYNSWFWEWVGAQSWASPLKSMAKGLGDFGKDFFIFFLYFLFLLGGLSDYKKYIDYVVGNNRGLRNNAEKTSEVYLFLYCYKNCNKPYYRGHVFPDLSDLWFELCSILGVFSLYFQLYPFHWIHSLHGTSHSYGFCPIRPNRSFCGPGFCAAAESIHYWQFNRSQGYGRPYETEFHNRYFWSGFLGLYLGHTGNASFRPP
jgi:hypothetical protein